MEFESPQLTLLIRLEAFRVSRIPRKLNRINTKYRRKTERSVTR